MRSVVLALATLCLLAAIRGRAGEPRTRAILTNRVLRRPQLPAIVAVARGSQRGETRLPDLILPPPPGTLPTPRQLVRVAVRELAHRSDPPPPAPASRGPPRG